MPILLFGIASNRFQSLLVCLFAYVCFSLHFISIVDATTCSTSLHFYDIFLGLYSFSEASAFAAKYGGHLATVVNPAENAFVCELKGSAEVWLGIDDNARDGQFVYSGGPLQGNPVGYTNFAAGEPNGGPTENCVKIGGSTRNCLWDDNPCTLNTRGFVLQFPPALPLSSALRCPQGYLDKPVGTAICLGSFCTVQECCTPQYITCAPPGAVSFACGQALTLKQNAEKLR